MKISQGGGAKTKRTGGTFNGVWSYCERHQPRVVILENIKAIDDMDSSSGLSNADACITLLEAIGYVCATTVLSPRDHGVPHRMKMMWFVCILISAGPLDDSLREQARPMLEDILGIVDSLRLRAPLLSDFIYEPESEELAAWMQRGRVTKEDRAAVNA